MTPTMPTSPSPLRRQFLHALFLTAAIATLPACTSLPHIIATNDTTTPVDLQIATPHPPPGSIQSPSGYFRVMLQPGQHWNSRRDARNTFISNTAPWGISGDWVFIATAPDPQGQEQTAEARHRLPIKEDSTTLIIKQNDINGLYFEFVQID